MSQMPRCLWALCSERIEREQLASPATTAAQRRHAALYSFDLTITLLLNQTVVRRCCDRNLSLVVRWFGYAIYSNIFYVIPMSKHTSYSPCYPINFVFVNSYKSRAPALLVLFLRTATKNNSDKSGHTYGTCYWQLLTKLDKSKESKAKLLYRTLDKRDVQTAIQPKMMCKH